MDRLDKASRGADLSTPAAAYEEIRVQDREAEHRLENQREVGIDRQLGHSILGLLALFPNNFSRFDGKNSTSTKSAFTHCH
ncbi:hypothetical protein [Roseivivax sp. CAU 1753]